MKKSNLQPVNQWIVEFRSLVINDMNLFMNNYTIQQKDE